MIKSSLKWPRKDLSLLPDRYQSKGMQTKSRLHTIARLNDAPKRTREFIQRQLSEARTWPLMRSRFQQQSFWRRLNRSRASWPFKTTHQTFRQSNSQETSRPLQLKCAGMNSVRSTRKTMRQHQRSKRSQIDSETGHHRKRAPKASRTSNAILATCKWRQWLRASEKCHTKS